MVGKSASENTLGLLSDPAEFHGPLDIRGEDAPSLRRQLQLMITIRMVERHLAAMKREQLIGGPVHLGVGQEAIAVGVARHLSPKDYVFGGHRAHSQVLASGSSIYRLFAEVLGRETGLSRGMGGSMHLWDGPQGFAGSVPIVGGTVPLAVGAGLGARLRGSDAVAVAYFGDGALEEGVVQESLNLASVLNIPVVFVVENNLFASHMHIDLRQPSNSTARFATANRITAEVVDGNDVVAVGQAAGRLIDAARVGHGPGFLEAITFRWYGHVDWREDIDVGVHRSLDELDAWKHRDPLRRLAHALEAMGQWSAAQEASFERDMEAEIVTAWARAFDDPYPAADALLSHVYAAGASQ